VLNTAAHWHKSSLFGEAETLDEMMQAYKRSVDTVLDTVQQYQHLTTYIRSSPYGHGNCSQYHEPSITPNAPNGTVPWEYEWHLFPKMNDIWKVSGGGSYVA
jgi:DNA polymerase phi